MRLSLPGQYLLHICHTLTATDMGAPSVHGVVRSVVATGLAAPVAAIDDDVDNTEQADHEDTSQTGADDDDGLVVVEDGL